MAFDPTERGKELLMRASAEGELLADRQELADALDALVRKHVPAGGKMTVARMNRIMAGYDEFRKQRYGTRRGYTRGTLYQMVARHARRAWLQSVDIQAAEARKLLGIGSAKPRKGTR